MNQSSVLSGRRNVLRKTLAVAATVTALTGLGVAGAVTPASASTQGSCGGIFNPSTGGGYAHWTLSCSGGRIYMDGYVQDTRSDGLCAQVKAVMNDGTYFSPKACPSGNRKEFHFNSSGSVADGYLFFS